MEEIIERPIRAENDQSAMKKKKVKKKLQSV